MDCHRKQMILHQIHELLNVSKKRELLIKLSAPFCNLLAADRPLVEYYACILFPSEKSHDFLLFFLLDICDSPVEAYSFFVSSSFFKLPLLEKDPSIIRRYLNRFILMRAVHSSLPKHLQRQKPSWREQYSVYSGTSNVFGDREALLGSTSTSRAVIENGSDDRRPFNANPLFSTPTVKDISINGFPLLPFNGETEPFRLHKRISLDMDSSLLCDTSIYNDSPINTQKNVANFYSGQAASCVNSCNSSIEVSQMDHIQEPSLISMNLDHNDKISYSDSEEEFWDALDIYACSWASNNEDKGPILEKKIHDIEPEKILDSQHVTGTVFANGSDFFPSNSIIKAAPIEKTGIQNGNGDDNIKDTLINGAFRHQAPEENDRLSNKIEPYLISTEEELDTHTEEELDTHTEEELDTHTEEELDTHTEE
ncbi:hypothetical protein DI09_96p10, partial [Mitosporidium daphniae]